MFSVKRNDSCKTLISVMPIFSTYTYTDNVKKKENSLEYSGLILSTAMIVLHQDYD